jgi:hypothetical protein
MTTVAIAPDAIARRLRAYVRANPDVRKAEYSGYDDPVEGACYVLAEAYFHAHGGLASGLDVYRLDWGDIYPDADAAHWFLRDDETIIDLSLPSAADGADVPFAEAQRRAFITGYSQPSNRTERVLEALDL